MLGADQTSAMSFWEHTREVIFERGVAVDRDALDAWHFRVATDLPAPPPQEIQGEFGLRPISARCRTIGTATDYSVVLPAGSGRLLNVTLTELQQLVYKRADWFISTQSLFFLLGAAIYHCERLAIHYRDEVKAHSGRQFLHDADRVLVQCFEAFYEFDALVTVVIRALDSIRYLVWQAFGGSGTTPSSFPRALRAVSRLPDGLKKELEDTWDTTFPHAKEYRDCIQHYVAVGSTSWSMLYRISGDVWGLTARIPDNPETRSARGFRFSKDYDALTYAWELTTALFGIVDTILQAACADVEVAPTQNMGVEQPRT